MTYDQSVAPTTHNPRAIYKSRQYRWVPVVFVVAFWAVAVVAFS